MTLQSTGAAVRGDDPTSRKILELAPWFHNLHLPSGHQTAPDHPLGDYPAFKWAAIAPTLPDDLSGWTALDIGCNAGYYSFELARRGAEVLAVDLDDHYLDQARWASALFDLTHRVRFESMQVYDLARLDTRFDLVLFLGVLYHLRYPLLALDLVAEKVDKVLVLQTLTMPGDEVVAAPANLPLDERSVMTEPGWPKMAFVEKRLAGDPTNWWAPDHSCVEAMVRSTGMRVVARPGHEIYICEPAQGPPPAVTAELDAATGRRGDLSS